MAEHRVFALGQSDLNGFLFASIGVEGSGMPLSVISALARLGLDPWKEAGRLAGLPPAVATDGLACLIAAMPASLWPMSVATPIAARLVALLPGHGAGHDVTVGAARFDWRWFMVVAIMMGLLAASVGYAPTSPNRTGSAPAANPTPAGSAYPPTHD
jgi:hypothetical protein